MQKKPLILALLAGLTLSGAAQAALNDRGGGLIYDDVLNITWLQNASYGAGSSYDTSDGAMTWANAVAWADSLVYHDSVRNVDYSDWRLPTMVDTGTLGCDWAYNGTDCGYNVQTASGGTVYSELAFMYYVNLGNKGFYDTSGNPQSGWGRRNAGPFVHLIASSGVGYWTGLEYAPNTDKTWYFNTYFGYQDAAYTDDDDHYAWAVHPGDVAAAPVPEPETYALMLAGLALVGVAARRRRG